MGFLEAYAGFNGKVAVVVGGAGGVGRALTLALARAGADIATFDKDADAIVAITSEVETLGRRLLAMTADVRDPAALDAFYDRVEQEFDRVDILVNVAGGVTRKPFMETTREQHAAEIRLNYGYVVDSVQRAVPLIRKGGRGGAIVNFTTIEAHRGAATFAVYSGAKAATGNFSRSIAVELAAEKIRVNVLAPDTTHSATSWSAVGPEVHARYEQLAPDTISHGYEIYIPQKSPPSEEDLANAMLFLVSDLARSITGITLHVDGGTMAAAGMLDWPFGDGHSPAPMAGTLAAMYEHKALD